MALLERSKLFNQPAELKKVVLPDGDIWIRPMTVKEAEEQPDDEAGWRTYVIRVSCCDEQGHPFFIDNDSEAIGELPSKYVDPLLREILSINQAKKLSGSEGN